MVALRRVSARVLLIELNSSEGTESFGYRRGDGDILESGVIGEQLKVGRGPVGKANTGKWPNRHVDDDKSSVPRLGRTSPRVTAVGLPSFTSPPSSDSINRCLKEAQRMRRHRERQKATYGDRRGRYHRNEAIDSSTHAHGTDCCGRVEQMRRGWLHVETQR